MATPMPLVPLPSHTHCQLGLEILVFPPTSWPQATCFPLSVPRGLLATQQMGNEDPNPIQLDQILLNLIPPGANALLGDN